MKGFFELDKPILVKPKTRTKIMGCEGCGLYKEVKSPRMPYTGHGRRGAFILAESPGRSEDLEGKQLFGEAGQLLRKCLRELGFSLDRDFWKQNAIRCRPTDSDGNNRTPTSKEIECCRPLWKAEIEELKPKFIFLMGAKAIEAYFMYRSQPITSDLSMGRWALQCVPDHQAGAWVICLYHPSFAVRTKEFEARFKRDLKWGVEQMKRKPPVEVDWREHVHPTTSFVDLITSLNHIIQDKPTIAVDFETSGLRPYKQGHHIWSIAISILGPAPFTFAFPYSYPGKWSQCQFIEIEDLMKEILGDEDIPKIAQSIQMEDPWSRRIIKADVGGWLHDTMVCSHLINEHRKFTSLDYQVFIRFGYEYGEEITPFKKGDDTGFNRMHEVPLLQLLEYNGLDALFTGLTFKDQVKLLQGV